MIIDRVMPQPPQIYDPRAPTRRSADPEIAAREAGRDHLRHLGAATGLVDPALRAGRISEVAPTRESFDDGRGTVHDDSAAPGMGRHERGLGKAFRGGAW